MRHLVFIFMMLSVSAADAAAQGQAPPKGAVDRGNFLGPVVKITRINGQSAVMVGGRGGWVLSDSLVWGLGGYVGINAATPAFKFGKF